MTASALNKVERFTRTAPVEETYLELEDQIQTQAAKLAARYGEDFSDLLSEAVEHFLQAYQTWDGRQPFAKFVYHRVRVGVIERVRRNCSERARYQTRVCTTSGGRRIEATLDVETIPDRERSGWILEEFLEELSDDARTVVQLVFDAPPELERMVERKGGEPRNWRSSIRQYLDRMGWTAVRITESFAEVASVLSE